MKLPVYILNILDTLEKAGYEAYVVGGAVRDALMNQTPKDYDICTSARPEQIQALFEKTIPTGIRHGTITVFSQGHPVEVTTYRQEGQYADHRHPDQVKFVRHIQEDLGRRDFTINAMAYHPKTGVVDPFGGQEDIEKKQIRCVGNPEDRFEEDALRMLRAFRFAARYHFQLDPALLKAIEEKADLMKYVATERMIKEMDEILEKDPDQLVYMTKLLEPWIPELAQCLACDQHSKWHYTDVLHHTIDAIKALDPYSKRAAMALLLHDLGKPACHTRDEQGYDHFKKHALASARIARRITKALGYSHKEQEKIAQLVLHHDDELQPNLKTLYRLRVLYHWDEQMVQDFLAVQKADIYAHTNHGADRMKKWQAFKDFYEENIPGRPVDVKDLAVDGHVLQEMGFQGRQIGEKLNKALEYAFVHPEKNNPQDLKAFIQKQVSHE